MPSFGKSEDVTVARDGSVEVYVTKGAIITSNVF